MILSTIHFACFLLDNAALHNHRVDLGKTDWRQACFIDITLLVFWTAIHSLHRVLKARKEAHPLQRTTHIALSAVAFEVLMHFWVRIPQITVWSTSATALTAAVYGCHIVAWSMLALMSVAVDHFELVGVKQTWRWWRGNRTTTTETTREHDEVTPLSPLAEKSAETQQLYEHMRHPALLPFIIIFWVTPHLSLDRLLLAVWLTAYLLLTHSLTRSDLQYVEYQLLVTFRQWVEDVNPFVWRATSRR
jgi:hypothetical protein